MRHSEILLDIEHEVLYFLGTPSTIATGILATWFRKKNLSSFRPKVLNLGTGKQPTELQVRLKASAYSLFLLFARRKQP